MFNGQPRWPNDVPPVWIELFDHDARMSVDSCGCLEIEDGFPLAKQMSFARQFIQSTDAWQTPWVNDRISPWRASRHTPQAWDIDDLLHEGVGADLFGQIRVPGRWLEPE